MRVDSPVFAVHLCVTLVLVITVNATQVQKSIAYQAPDLHTPGKDANAVQTGRRPPEDQLTDVTVFIDRAANLRPVTTTTVHKMVSPYVSISLTGSGMVAPLHISSTKHRANEPVWNENLSYQDVPINIHARLAIEVHDKSASVGDVLLGVGHVDIERAIPLNRPQQITVPLKSSTNQPAGTLYLAVTRRQHGKAIPINMPGEMLPAAPAPDGTGTVVVGIKRARGLFELADASHPSTTGNKPDSQVQIEMPGHEPILTKERIDDANPVWMDTLVFTQVHDPSTHVRFTVLDNDGMLGNDELGTAVVPIASLGAQPTDMSLQLKHNGEPAGFLDVSLSYNPPTIVDPTVGPLPRPGDGTGNVDVWIESAQDLRAADGFLGLNVEGDPYIVLSMAGHDEQRTQSKHQTKDPVFRSAFRFSNVLDTTVPIGVTVMDEDAFSQDDLIGSSEINLNHLTPGVVHKFPLTVYTHSNEPRGKVFVAVVYQPRTLGMPSHIVPSGYPTPPPVPHHLQKKLAKKCPHDCNGHGDCIDGICSCYAGWLGGACETKTIVPPALKHPASCLPEIIPPNPPGIPNVPGVSVGKKIQPAYDPMPPPIPHPDVQGIPRPINPPEPVEDAPALSDIKVPPLTKIPDPTPPDPSVLPTDSVEQPGQERPLG